MTEDDTFRALKKLPYPELRKIWGDWMFNLDLSDHWDEILEQHLWSREEWDRSFGEEYTRSMAQAIKDI